MSKTTLVQKLQTNWKSGLTVSLVSVPLAISLAIASGTSPIAGIVTAIWAGLFASLLGGSHYNVVGPTAALSGILATYALTNGAETLPTVAIVTGVIILLAYLLGLARFIIYIPANTIHGFTLGVALTIAMGQLNFALGLQNLPIHEHTVENFGESITHLGQTSLAAAITFGVFLALMFVITKISNKLPKILQLPPAVLLSPIGILLGYLSVSNMLPFRLLTLGEKYNNLNPTLFITHSFDLNQAIITTSLTVALIAILETIISAKIADGMTKTKHNRNKEVLGLGIANIASGIMGGIPATAALARTVVNIKSGANNQLSSTINSLCIIIISLLLLTFFKFIPLAVIAAILVNVAIRMVTREDFVKLYKIDKKNFWIAILVAILTVYIDPIIGVLVGAAVSLFFFLDTLSRGQFDMVTNNHNNEMIERVIGDKVYTMPAQSHTLVYSIKGHLTYVDSLAHTNRFEHDIQEYEHVVLRLRELYFLDVDGLEAFDEIVEIIEARNKKVYLSGVNPLIEQILLSSKHFSRLKDSGAVFSSTTKALKTLGFEIHDQTKPELKLATKV